jgi:hypothetical protein
LIYSVKVLQQDWHMGGQITGAAFVVLMYGQLLNAPPTPIPPIPSLVVLSGLYVPTVGGPAPPTSDYYLNKSITASSFKSGKLKRIGDSFVGGPSPSWMIAHPTLPIVYALNGVEPGAIRTLDVRPLTDGASNIASAAAPAPSFTITPRGKPA